MNKQFSLGKIVIHDKNGTSLHHTLEDVLSYLDNTTAATKVFGPDTDLRPLAARSDLRKRIKSTLEDPYTHDDIGTDPYAYGDPLEPLTRLSEDLKLYEGVGTNGDSGQRDPVNIGYANINVSIEGDKWFANDLLSVLEATILDTIREYKEFNSGARGLKTTVGTNTQSSQ